MTGCDEERERIQQEIAARVQRLTPEQTATAQGLQEAYRQRRRKYLEELYREAARRIAPEMAQGEANGQENDLPAPTGETFLL